MIQSRIILKRFASTANMAVNRVFVSKTAEFDEILKRESAVSGAKGQLFVLFTGDHDESGKSWCPDCNDAKPVIEQVLAEAAAAKGGVTIVECPLVRAEYKGNAQHYYRTHAQIKLQRIPTLMRWGARSKTGELIEEACRDVGLVRELLLE